MKSLLLAYAWLLCFAFNASAQAKITTVETTISPAPSGYAYNDGIENYNWGIAPNNASALVEGFTAGDNSYSYATALTGVVKLRRVNNLTSIGNLTLVWSESIDSGTTYHLFSEYQNNMEAFYNSRIYNRGSDNFFDNTSSNSNNIERMDWIIAAGYGTGLPEKAGFAIFERGAAESHEPFCIAAITSVDAVGNPTSYGPIVRIASPDYGDSGPSVTYRIMKAKYPNNLLTAGSGTQGRGGVFVSLQDLGVAVNQPIYGYSLFSADLPESATSADLVDYTNPTYFPTNTGKAGGIDLIAVTGFFTESATASTHFINLTATEKAKQVLLNWKVENETAVDHYEVEKSVDGMNFSTIAKQSVNSTGGTNNYTYTDNNNLSSAAVYYRIKQYDRDGTFYYSKTPVVKRYGNVPEVVIYPNPLRDNLNLNVNVPTAGVATVSGWNATGAQVFSQQFNLTAGSNVLTVTGVDKLPVGIYQIHVALPEGKVFTQPVLKQ